jgi:hypothetical protein
MAIIDNTKSRSYVIQGIIVGIFVVYLIRLFYLQIIDDTYKQIADDRGLEKSRWTRIGGRFSTEPAN